MLQIASYFFVIGIIWFVVDAFLIPGLVRARQDEVRRRIAFEMLGPDPRTSVPSVGPG
ncbi:hypothetical protein [Xanthobacter sp. KR7-225]|uniref:hypothetical protein n=1 Tax=Xanthobacter sp. KR7-225 TaxID=3156613 RepID=UPI0032B61FEF